MATDFNTNTVQVKGPLKIVPTNAPLDIRTVVETESDILSIPKPYIGMIIYVKDSGKRFEALTLKPARVGLQTVPDSAIDTYRELPYATQDYVIQKISEAELSNGGGTSGDLSGYSPVGHLHEINDVNGLQAALNNKSDKDHEHPSIANEIEDINMALMMKSDEGHSHDDLASKTYVNDEIAKAALSGGGDIDTSDLVSKTEMQIYVNETVNTSIDDALKNASFDDYALKKDVEQALEGKSNEGHIHEIDGINGLNTAIEQINILISESERKAQSALDAVTNKSDEGHKHDELYAELGHYHLLSDLPEVLVTQSDLYEATEDLASITYVSQEITRVVTEGKVDLTGYATESYVNEALEFKADEGHKHDEEYAALGHVHLLSDLPESIITQSDLYDTISDYAKSSEVEQKIETAMGNVKVDLSSYYTKVETNDMLNLKSDEGHKHDEEYAELGHVHLLSELPETLVTQSDLHEATGDLASIQYVTQEITKAVTDGKVDLTGYATETYVNESIKFKADAEHKHDEDYAEKDHTHNIDELPSEVITQSVLNDTINDYAKTSEVEQKIETAMNNVKVDLSGYYTKVETNEALNLKADEGHKHDELYAGKDHVHDMEDLPADIVLEAELNEAISDLASIQYVTQEITKAVTEGKVDLTGYATESFVNEALKFKADEGHKHDEDYANKNHVHELNELPDNLITTQTLNDIISNYAEKEEMNQAISTAIEPKANKSEVPTLLAFNNLSTSVSNKADEGHGHEISKITNLQSILDEKALKSELTNLATKTELNNKADISALSNLATKTEVNDKAPLLHTHNINEITDLQTILNNKASIEELNKKLETTTADNRYQQITDTNLKTSNKTIVGAINELQAADITLGARIGTLENATSTYQLKQDNSLATVNKTIIGAINELKDLLDDIRSCECEFITSDIIDAAFDLIDWD